MVNSQHTPTKFISSVMMDLLLKGLHSGLVRLTDHGVARILSVKVNLSRVLLKIVYEMGFDKDSTRTKTSSTFTRTHKKEKIMEIQRMPGHFCSV